MHSKDNIVNEYYNSYTLRNKEVISIMGTLTIERELTLDDLEDALNEIDRDILSNQIAMEKSEHQNCGGGKSGHKEV